MTSHAYSRLFYHFVWATRDRESLLEGEIKKHAYALIRQRCKDMKCKIHALSGISDHVHLVVSLPTTLSIADFIESIKGSSSRALNEAHSTNTLTFGWQPGYGVLTVSPSLVRTVIQYVEKQEEHHRNGTTKDSAERITPP